MPFSSEVNTGLPETPAGIHNHHLYEELLLIYNAIRALQSAFNDQVPGTQGPQGAPGSSGNNSQGGAVPYYIAPGQTVIFPAPYQFLFCVIDNEGIIDCEGLLIHAA